MRVNCFMRAESDTGHQVTIEGRRNVSTITADFNTDNAVGRNINLSVRAIGGQAKSRFDITLPQLSEQVEIYINGQLWTGFPAPVPDSEE